MFVFQSRLILQHAAPMLIAQLASMGMMVIDTALLGHYGTEDLAAVAVGGGIYIAVVFALTGILQAVSPTVSHLLGAGRTDEAQGMSHRDIGNEQHSGRVKGAADRGDHGDKGQEGAVLDRIQVDQQDDE